MEIDLIIGKETIYPLHPNINMHTPHTALYAFSKVLTRRMCLTIQSFFNGLSFPLISDLNAVYEVGGLLTGKHNKQEL